MVDTKKFSEFPTGGVLETGDRPVGLEGSTNTIWDFEGSSGSGESIITVEQDTTMLAVTDWVRMDEATGEYVKAIATDEENAEVAGVVLEILDDTTMRVQQSGYIFPNTPDFNDFTAGVTYFLSDTLLGNQTPAIPTTNGYVKKPVFIATGEDSGWVCCLLAGQVVGTPPPINQSVPSGSDTNIHTVSQSGNKFDVGDAVRVNGDTTYTLALADTPTNALAVGFVRNNGDPNFTIQFAGWCSNVVTSAVDDLGNPIALASGQAYYLSDVDLGSITPNPPTTLGAASRPIFICESHTNLTGWIFAEFPKELEGANEFATRELDNLQNTAVNTDIMPADDNTHDLGDIALRWANIYAFRLGDNTLTNTRPFGTNDTTIATTAFVQNAVAGGGGGFANRELDNLQNTAANTDINPDTDLAHALGQPALRWANIYAGVLAATTGNITTLNSTTGNIDTVNANTVNAPNISTTNLGNNSTTNTQPNATNDTTIATTAFVQNAIAGSGGGVIRQIQFMSTKDRIVGPWYLGGYLLPITILAGNSVKITFTWSAYLGLQSLEKYFTVSRIVGGVPIDIVSLKGTGGSTGVSTIFFGGVSTLQANINWVGGHTFTYIDVNPGAGTHIYTGQASAGGGAMATLNRTSAASGVSAVSQIILEEIG